MGGHWTRNSTQHRRGVTDKEKKEKKEKRNPTYGKKILTELPFRVSHTVEHTGAGCSDSTAGSRLEGTRWLGSNSIERTRMHREPIKVLGLGRANGGKNSQHTNTTRTAKARPCSVTVDS